MKSYTWHPLDSNIIVRCTYIWRNIVSLNHARVQLPNMDRYGTPSGLTLPNLTVTIGRFPRALLYILRLLFVHYMYPSLLYVSCRILCFRARKAHRWINLCLPPCRSSWQLHPRRREGQHQQKHSAVAAFVIVTNLILLTLQTTLDGFPWCHQWGASPEKEGCGRTRWPRPRFCAACGFVVLIFNSCSTK